MTEPQLDTWHSRDLPFLRALVDQLELTPHTPISAADVGVQLGMDDNDVTRALRNLTRGEYVTTRPYPRRMSDGPTDAPLDVTEKALYVVGVWPSPEAAADRLVAALAALAKDGPDEPTRTRARSALEQVGGFGRDTLAAIAATVITGQLPGSPS
jgi:hypothetical protein